MPTTITDVELDCTGEVRLGSLSPETLERLATLGGAWLELGLQGRRLVPCHVQPGGPPTLAALPAELIAFLDALTAEERGALPGGALVVRDRAGSVVRLVVARGEIHVQWPREDWTQVEPVDLDSILAEIDSASARISGRVSFDAEPGAEDRLVEFVGRFDGLYPEGDLLAERRGAQGRTLHAELSDVNVGPGQLLATLRCLADPSDSLEGELEVGSFLPHAQDRDFRLTLHRGTARAVRPTLWPAD